MIRFFVNNHELVLPHDFSVTIEDENPMLTSNGEFSLDIDISLLEARNAKAFGHVNRLNKNIIQKDFESYCIIDGKIRFGKMVLISNSNTSIKTQFVAGNSELNYLIKNDKKIWELDWGTESNIDYTRALASVQNNWNGNFVCAPVKFSGTIANEFVFAPVGPPLAYLIDSVNNIAMQPFLKYYINRIAGLLGFTMGTNVLNSDTLFLKMILPNSNQSLKYGDCLPDISISQFIKDIEAFFSVSFVLNKLNKVLDIINVKESIANKNIVHISNVFDSYSRENNPDESSNLDFKMLSYDIPKSGYGLYQSIDKDFSLKFSTEYHPNFDAMKIAAANTSQYLNKTIKLKNNQLQNDFILATHPIKNVNRCFLGNNSNTLINVDKFSSYGSNVENEYILPITPCSMEYIEINKNVATIVWLAPYQIPYVNRSLFEFKDKTPLQIIETNITNVPRPSKIEVFLFGGMIPLIFQNPNHGFDEADKRPPYPISYVDNVPEFWVLPSMHNKPNTNTYNDLFWDWALNVYKSRCNQTLRIKGTDGIYERYHKNVVLDQSLIYYFDLLDNPELNANVILDYNNGRYLPISLVREFLNGKTSLKLKAFKMI